MRKDKRVNSVTKIDMHGMELPVFYVYDRPEDYPKKAVARLYDMNMETNMVIVKNSLEEIREDMEKAERFIFIPGDAIGDPEIIGIWT